MSSFRSLVTFIILIGVGYFLFTRINDGPQGAGGQQLDEAPEGVPPFTGLSAPSTSVGGFEATPGSQAPQWSAPAAAPPPAVGTTPNASTEMPPVPAIPKMPDMPDLSADPSAAPPLPGGLPANIPTAEYSGTATLPPEGISGRVPSLGSTTPNLAGIDASPSPVSPNSTSLSPSPPMTPGMPPTPEIAAAPAVSSPLAAAPVASAPPIAAPPTVEVPAMPDMPSVPPVAAATIAEDNRYGEVSPAPAEVTAAPTAVGGSSFAEGWPAIQAALERGELARAHLLLSQWYADPSLTPAESQQVESLLSQLAGTVVYSTDHQLEPAYVVRPGDTLETIAQQYSVPWQLLAKINGIPAANQVRPGQQLKVVRGPFSAVIELSRNQLTLMLDGRYAGKFPIDASAAALPAGEWVVAEKPASPLQQASPYGATMPAAPAVARSLQLRNASATDADPGPPITIGSAPPVESHFSGAGGMNANLMQAAPYLVRVSPNDADELVDILSVGSRIEIRR